MSTRLTLARKLQRSIEKAGGTISTYVELFSKQGEHSIGLRAAKDIPAFQCIASIPVEMCLVESLMGGQTENEASAKLIENLLRKKQQTVTQTHLGKVDNNVDDMSLFSQYLALLPSSENMVDFPSQWSTEQWSGITNTTLHHIHKSKQQDITHIFKQQQSQSQSTSGFSLADYIWGDDILSSRCYGQSHAKALVPFLDLCNHENSVHQQPLGTTGCIVVSSQLCSVLPCLLVQT
jgi:hypothetical protein